MTDAALARPVVDDEIYEYERRAPSVLARHHTTMYRINSISLIGNAALLLAVFALAAGLVFVVLQRKVVPVFISVNADGSHEILRDLSELSPSKRSDVVKNELWAVAMNWEEYSYMGNKRRYDTVVALTAGEAQKQYVEWFTRSPDSPQQKYGKTGGVHVAAVPNSAEIKGGGVDQCRNMEWCEATLSFWRTDQIGTPRASAKKHYTAEMAFVFVDGLEPGQSETLNAAGIKVISYHSNCDDCASQP